MERIHSTDRRFNYKRVEEIMIKIINHMMMVDNYDVFFYVPFSEDCTMFDIERVKSMVNLMLSVPSKFKGGPMPDDASVYCALSNRFQLQISYGIPEYSITDGRTHAFYEIIRVYKLEENKIPNDFDFFHPPTEDFPLNLTNTIREIRDAIHTEVNDWIYNPIKKISISQYLS